MIFLAIIKCEKLIKNARYFRLLGFVLGIYSYSAGLCERGQAMLLLVEQVLPHINPRNFLLFQEPFAAILRRLIKPSLRGYCGKPAAGCHRKTPVQIECRGFVDHIGSAGYADGFICNGGQ